MQLCNLLGWLVVSALIDALLREKKRRKIVGYHFNYRLWACLLGRESTVLTLCIRFFFQVSHFSPKFPTQRRHRRCSHRRQLTGALPPLRRNLPQFIPLSRPASESADSAKTRRRWERRPRPESMASRPACSPARACTAMTARGPLWSVEPAVLVARASKQSCAAGGLDGAGHHHEDSTAPDSKVSP